MMESWSEFKRQQLRAYMRALSQRAKTQSEAARISGVHRSRVWKWYRQNPDIRAPWQYQRKPRPLVNA